MSTLWKSTAQAIANHWLASRYPAFTGPKLTWPDLPEIKDWQESRTVPTEIDLAEFSRHDQFAPIFKCVVEYQDKLLRSSFSCLAETHEIVSIEIRCNSEIDPETNALVENKLFVFGRLLAKPKAP